MLVFLLEPLMLLAAILETSEPNALALACETFRPHNDLGEITWTTVSGETHMAKVPSSPVQALTQKYTFAIPHKQTFGEAA